MKKIVFLGICCLVILNVFISACSSQKASNASDGTLEYLRALADKDKTRVITLSCKAWEEQAALEVDALLSVGASLNNVECKTTGSEGDLQQVTCSGNLDLTYNDEIRSIDLSSRIYSMAMEDGQWRVCSYK